MILELSINHVGSAASSPAPKPMVMSTSGGQVAQQSGHPGAQTQQQTGGSSGAGGGGGPHNVPQFQAPQLHVDKGNNMNNMVMLPTVIPTQG